MTKVVLSQAGKFAPGEGPGEDNIIAALVQKPSGYTVVEKSADVFEIAGASSSGFAGWHLRLSAAEFTQFSYVDGSPTGSVGEVKLFDSHGQLVMTLTDVPWLADLHDWALPGAFSAFLDVKGSGGDDLIAADPALDSWYGATIAGGGGDDTISGARGSDLIDGGSGDDVIMGGDSADSLAGGTGDDSLNGGSGLDTLEGGGGNDTLDGGDASDTLSGGAGRNLLTGGGGSDVINVDGVGDRVSGGEGDDTVILRSTAVQLKPAVIDGGDGYDSLSLKDSVGAFTLYLDRHGPGITATGFEQVLLNGHGDTVYGGSGTDDITGGGGADLINGGDGADLLQGGGGPDTLIGAAGRDFLTGGAGADYLSGGLDEDEIVAGSGDTVLGGAGDDHIMIEAGAAATLDGGAGIDSAGFDSPMSAGFHIDLRKDVQRIGDSKLVLDSIEGFSGGSGADVLIGNGDANRLSGGWGDDKLIGGAGADDLDAGSGSATVTGGAGDDWLSADLGDGDKATLNGGQGDDVLSMSSSGAFSLHAEGGAGTDRLIISSYGDSFAFDAGSGVVNVGAGRIEFRNVESFEVWGGSGDDTLTGGAGADVFDGAFGDDQLAGGGGDDQLSFGYGHDTLDGGDGFDMASFWGSAPKLSLSLAKSGEQAVGSGESVIFISIEGLAGDQGADRLAGNGEDNRLEGNGGADTLVGAAGNDTLEGGGWGDVLIGGSGSDVFRYSTIEDSTPDTPDRIRDLGAGDLIDLSRIDADVGTAGDQQFEQVDAFTGEAGQIVVSWKASTNLTFIQADVDGDSRADLSIVVIGDHRDFDGLVL